MTKQTAVTKKAKETKKLTATQRISYLEEIVERYGAHFEAVGNELDTMRNLISSLAKRLNASIQATESDDSVKKIIIDQNIQELQGKVDFLIQKGVLAKGDVGYQVSDKSFIVGRELDSAGKVINPRIQFSIGSVLPELKELIYGKKVGDVFAPNNEDTENPVSIEITELYQIVDPKIDKNFEDQSAQAEAR